MFKTPEPLPSILKPEAKPVLLFIKLAATFATPWFVTGFKTLPFNKICLFLLQLTRASKGSNI